MGSRHDEGTQLKAFERVIKVLKDDGLYAALKAGVKDFSKNNWEKEFKNAEKSEMAKTVGELIKAGGAPSMLYSALCDELASNQVPDPLTPEYIKKLIYDWYNQPTN